MATTNTAPILNDYKITFARRRVVQVVLGGVVLFFSDSSFVPVSVYLLQIALFFLPLAVGLPLILLHGPLITFLTYDWIPALIFGGVVGMFTFITKCMSIHVQRRDAARSDAGHGGAGADAGHACASLSEEQEYHFDRLWSAELFAFLFPVPSHSHFWLLYVLFQSLFSGCICFGGYFYMLPSNLKLSFHEMPIIVFEVIGWISLLTCQYSLTARPPPEPNQFKSYDAYGFSTYTRTSYLFILFALNLAYKWIPNSQTIEILYYVNKACHVVFLCLPLAFTIGLLPQIEVLFGWIVEQVHIFFLGGSATASNFRLCFLSIIGAANVAIVYSVYMIYDFLSPGLGAGLGFLLSSDIVSFSKKQVRSGNNSISPDNVPRTRVRLSHHPFVNFLLSLMVGCAAGAIAAFANKILGDRKSFIRLVVDVVLLAALVCHVLFTQLQRPFLFSLVRNPWFSKFNGVFSFISLASSILGSIAMTVLLCLFVFPHTNSRSRILLPRAFRWVWQSTPAALLEMVVVEWCIIYVFPAHNWDLQLLLFYAALADDRLFQFLSKMHYVICSFASVLTVKKLRFPYYKLVVGLQILFFPLVIAIVLLSCVLSAPILPFLGVPIFLIGFPRPLRVWQTSGKNYQQTKDTIYYKQLVPRLVGEMAKSFGRGVMGWGTVGDMYLLRLESKLVWVHILERGNSYASVLIKGLELQETSCHHAEAGKIDEIIERTLDSEEPPLFNQYFLNTLLPLGRLPVLTYANNNMTLTGIIDHPDNLKLIPEFFWKTLVFVLRKWRTRERLAARQQQISKLVPMCRESIAKFPTGWHNLLNTKGKMRPTPRPKKSRPTSPSPRSSSPRSSRPPTPTPVTTMSAWAHPSPLPPLTALSPPSPRYGPSSTDPLDDFLSEWTAIQKGNDYHEQPRKLSEPPRKLSEPPSWNGLGEDNGGGQAGIAEFKSLRRTLEPIAGRAPRDSFVDLVCVCHCIIEVLGGYQDVFSGPRHVYDIYMGHIPSSAEASFLEGDEELSSMVLLAYKYAFKLVFDQSVLGEFESDAEILTQLEEFHKSWYFGMDNTDEWLDNIEAETENMFSIDVNQQGVYSAHFLSLRKQTITVSKLNGEGARAMWSSLNQELLFFTNDDDERYSIQAHAGLLRNITVQAAEPPLGYPVFGCLYDIPL